MTDQTAAPAQTRVIDIIAVGFAQTVAMWAVGYVCRLSPGIVPGWLLLALMLACMLCGGLVVGGYTPRGWRGGLAVGILSAVLNMMILGSLLGGDRPNQIVPSALWWLPGSILTGAVVGATGAKLGGLFSRQGPADVNWTSVLARTAAVACLLLLIAGGLVTSKEAGLAVTDWPNSFGYNMFLYPLGRMTGGIYYEHTHRLLGSLLGLSVIVLAVHLWRSERRRWLSHLALIVLLLVILQGVLGGLRVTGRLTFSTSRWDMAPSIRLAAVHGVLGQAVFATLVAIATFTSTRWLRSPRPTPSRYAATDRILNTALIAVLGLQLVLGAALRHTYVGLTIHIAVAVLVVLLALACGLRSFGLHEGSLLRRMGLSLLVLAVLQVILGVAALVATGAMALRKPPPPIEVVLATAHQVAGALLLACAVAFLLWHRRTISPSSQ